MKLDFNKPVLDLEDQPIKGADSLGKILAGYLSTAQKQPDPLKLMDWARILFKGEILDLDKSDQKKLQTFIETHEFMQVQVQAQLIEVLDKKEVLKVVK